MPMTTTKLDTGRWVNFFFLCGHLCPPIGKNGVRKIQKKIQLQSKYKYIKNIMATAIAQKSYKALFPLWSLKKKDILKLIN